MCLRTNTRAHRDGAVGEALGGADDVGHHAEILGREAGAEAAEAGDDLVEDQQDAVLVADLAQPLQVALRRDQHAGRARDRLDDHRGDVRRVVQRDDALQLVGQVGAPFRLAPAEGVMRLVMGVRHVIDAGSRLPKNLRLVTMPPTEMPPKPTP